MIFGHDIPEGSRLYFGKSAKLKRELESRASEIFYKYNFSEILTPAFSYQEHQMVEDKNSLIRINNEANDSVVLRNDTSLDVVRLLSKRVSTDLKRWFYIEPIFRYPTTELYQIGAEILDTKDIVEAINIAKDILNQFGLSYHIEIANVNIPKLISKELNINISLINDKNFLYIKSLNIDWLTNLLEASKFQDINMEIMPMYIVEEVAKFSSFENSFISPLFHSNLLYYQDLVFRFFVDNETIATGGRYLSNDREIVGFALFLDNIIQNLLHSIKD